MTLNGLHGVISQKIAVFITTAIGTSYLTATFLPTELSAVAEPVCSDILNLLK
jgi:hypothetical protein